MVDKQLLKVTKPDRSDWVEIEKDVLDYGTGFYVQGYSESSLCQ